MLIFLKLTFLNPWNYIWMYQLPIVVRACRVRSNVWWWVYPDHLFFFGLSNYLILTLLSLPFLLRFLLSLPIATITLRLRVHRMKIFSLLVLIRLLRPVIILLMFIRLVSGTVVFRWVFLFRSVSIFIFFFIFWLLFEITLEFLFVELLLIFFWAFLLIKLLFLLLLLNFLHILKIFLSLNQWN